jgi:hypothetical protein
MPKWLSLLNSVWVNNPIAVGRRSNSSLNTHLLIRVRGYSFKESAVAS